MSDFRSWRTPFRAMCPEPGPRDAMLVVIVNGVRLGIHPLEDHVRLRELTERLAVQMECQIKVLPMTTVELFALYGIKPEPKPMSDMDPAFRRQAIQNFMDVLRDSHDPDQRAEAMDMLDQLGAVQ